MDRFTDVVIDQGYTDIYKLMRSSKLLVFDYNRTGFLEAVAQNIPSILICDFSICELSHDARANFDPLTSCKVHFRYPYDAAEHINRIWQDVGMWWNSDDVRGAVEHIRARYCQPLPSKVERISDALINQMALAK